MKVNIIGAGLAGAIMARRYKDAGHEPIVYERDRVMGACWENKDYQLYPHFFHTNIDEVMEFVLRYTTIKPYRHLGTNYSGGEYFVFPPKEIDEKIKAKSFGPYNIKMWHDVPKKNVIDRIKPSNGCLHSDSYQGVLDMPKLFENLLEGIEVKLGYDITSNYVFKGEKIVLTGAVDEYYDYMFGELPYRGMQVSHLKTETGLPTATVNFPESDFPFIRMTDYRKFGYGNYIGIEAPCDDIKHYPVINEESEKLYNRYYIEATKNDITLIGRLASYKYQDMDKVIKDCLEVEI